LLTASKASALPTPKKERRRVIITLLLFLSLFRKEAEGFTESSCSH
jgi:hypothetical protein